VYGPASLSVMAPEHPGAEDTVVFYSICSNSTNTLLKVSVGLLWGQLRAGGAIGEPGWPVSVVDDRLRVEPNPCRGSATLSFTGPLDHSTTGPLSLSLYDAAGRLVFKSPIAIRQSPFALDLRSVPAGVYLLRVKDDTGTHAARLVVER